MGTILIFTFVLLLALPTANAQITTVTGLYSDSERALEILISEASRLPQTRERRDVINSLSAYATVLQTLQKADRLRAKFLGLPVTWGLIKTLLVTIFTLIVGLWSILRGLGVFFTWEAVCPIQE